MLILKIGFQVLLTKKHLNKVDQLNDWFVLYPQIRFDSFFIMSQQMSNTSPTNQHGGYNTSTSQNITQNIIESRDMYSSTSQGMNGSSTTSEQVDIFLLFKK